MANIGTLLKQEIARLSRKETRTQVRPVQKASAHYRRQIAALKRQVLSLERQVSLLERRVPDTPATARGGAAPQKLRFVPKGLKSHRNRLGLSAADFGRLVGVSAQSIYNWELGHSSPRAEQLRAIAAIRSIGKRDAHRRIEQLGPKRAPKSAKR